VEARPSAGWMRPRSAEGWEGGKASRRQNRPTLEAVSEMVPARATGRGRCDRRSKRQNRRSVARRELRVLKPPRLGLGNVFGDNVICAKLGNAIQEIARLWLSQPCNRLFK